MSRCTADWDNKFWRVCPISSSDCPGVEVSTHRPPASLWYHHHNLGGDLNCTTNVKLNEPLWLNDLPNPKFVGNWPRIRRQLSTGRSPSAPTWRCRLIWSTEAEDFAHNISQSWLSFHLDRRKSLRNHRCTGHGVPWRSWRTWSNKINLPSQLCTHSQLITAAYFRATT